MITEELFKKIINNYQTFNDKLDALEAIIGTSFFDNPFVESYWSMFEEVLKAYFNECGQDDILWWLLEKKGNPEFKMYDANHNEIPTETIDDLWNIVKCKRI